MATLGSDITGTAADGAGHPSAAEGGVPGADNVASPKKPNASEAAQADAETTATIAHSAQGLSKSAAKALVAHMLANTKIKETEAERVARIVVELQKAGWSVPDGVVGISETIRLFIDELPNAILVEDSGVLAKAGLAI